MSIAHLLWPLFYRRSEKLLQLIGRPAEVTLFGKAYKFIMLQMYYFRLGSCVMQGQKKGEAKSLSL